MIDTAEILSKYIAELSFDDLPDSTVQNTRLFMLDYFAAAMAGYRMNKTFNSAVEQYLFEKGGKAESSVLFSKKKLPCEDAAFLNACYAHGADMDDGNRKAMGHVGAHVISAVLALAEKIDATEKEVIVAINAGYEVYCRIAAAAQPGLVHRGFHSTGTAGVIACAAACAKLMGMNAEGIYNAMAISVTQASGLMIIAESGQSIKPLNPANAARCGILSAYLTSKGVKGGNRPLESEKGWFHAMSDKLDYSMITDGLGERFCIDECYIKPYPSCRHTHCGLEAAKIIMENHKIDSSRIQKVNVYIYSNAIQIAGQIKCPCSDDESKFSIHYSIACMLTLGMFGLDQLEVSEMSSSTRDMISKIELIADETMENRDAGIRGCRVEVILDNGCSYEETVLIPMGDPEKPFGISNIREKIKQCAGNMLNTDQQSELIDRLLTFGNKKYRWVGL